METFTEVILSGDSIFVDNGIFYLKCFYLVSAHWKCSNDKVLLAPGNFKSLVELQYTDPYTAELYGCLIVIQFIDLVLAGSILLQHIPITIGTNYASLINHILSMQLVTLFSTYLH